MWIKTGNVYLCGPAAVALFWSRHATIRPTLQHRTISAFGSDLTNEPQEQQSFSPLPSASPLECRWLSGELRPQLLQTNKQPRQWPSLWHHFCSLHKGIPDLQQPCKKCLSSLPLCHETSAFSVTSCAQRACLVGKNVKKKKKLFKAKGMIVKGKGKLKDST